LDEFLAVAGLIGLLFVKEAGVPIPVPGDLLVLGAGVAAAANPASGLVVLAGILLAGYAGGVIQFVLVRGGLRRALLSVLTRLGVPQARIESLADRLRRSGARGVALARVTPGVRVPAIAASGLAALPLIPFTGGLIAGNTAFVTAHFALGFAVGAPALTLLETSGPAVAIGGVIVLAVVGAVGWLILRRRRLTGLATEPAAGAFSRDSYSAWADAACPACLTLAVLRPDRLG
jgi:membrane protein DedA with SNARE-associated domain